MRKYISWSLLIAIVAASSAHAIDVQRVDVQDYASLAAALSALNSGPDVNLHITNTQTVSGWVYVGSNITVVVAREGLIVNGGGARLTFLRGSKLKAGPYEIFSGWDSGGIRFYPGTVDEVCPEWWGAVADGGGATPTDNHPKFKAAYDSFYTTGDRGGKISIGGGDYFLGQTWEIAKQMTIAGKAAGNTIEGSASQLIFPANTTGIRVTKGYSTIRDLTIHCNDKQSSGHGVSAVGAVYLEKVTVEYFAGNGFHIVATSGSGDPEVNGNANFWKMEDCQSNLNGGHGLYVDGADVNAGVCSKLSSVNNDGWQIYDSSLLGNAYIECHTASQSRKSFKTESGCDVLVGCYSEIGQNRQLAPGTLVLGGVFGSSGQDLYPWVTFAGDGSGAEGVVVSTGGGGAITEILMTSYGSGYTTASASIYPPSGSGAVLTPVIDGGKITSVTINNGGSGYFARTPGANIIPDRSDRGFRTDKIRITNRAPGSDRAADLVLAERANMLMTMGVTESPGTFDAFAWNEAAKSYESEYNGSPGSAGIRFVSDISTTETGGRSTPLPAGSVEFPKGLWIGAGADGRQRSTAAAAPASGQHAQGDMVWNSNPIPGGYVGWICKVGGTPGVWTGFGIIAGGDDSDLDGVPDALDLCPDTPPGTLVNADGCPDSDQDGVADSNDLCPDTPPGHAVDADGCIDANDITVTIDTLAVGNPGNASDPVSPYGGIWGGVDYEFEMAIYEVTNAQYCDFLNAKAATSDPYGLYNSHQVEGWGVNRTGSGTAGDPWVYTPHAGRDDQAVYWVSVWDCLRFCNWMTNGQGSGDTETGTYTIPAYWSDPYATAVARDPGAEGWVLPTVDEWHKAAYYNPATAAYYDYPTSSDTAPTYATPPDPGTNVAAIQPGAGNNTPTDAYPNTVSPYGMQGMAGMAQEFTETTMFFMVHPETDPYTDGNIQRGGNWSNDEINTRATYSLLDWSTVEQGNLGFRVAWIGAARPPCWDYLTQCHGDSDDDGDVDTVDWPVFRDAFGYAYPAAQYNPCGDMDHDGDVDTVDWPEFRDNFGYPAPADCPGGGTWPPAP